MNINIKTTTISMTPAISEYIDKHLDSVKKFLESDPTAKCDLEIAKTTNHHKNGDIFKAEMHIVAKDQNIYTSVEKDDLYAAIDILKDEVIRKLKSEKSKQRSFLRKGGAKIKDLLKGITNRR